MSPITIAQVEGAINNCSRAHPPVEGKATAEALRLCDLYGQMIFCKLASVESGSVAEDIRDLLNKWM